MFCFCLVFFWGGGQAVHCGAAGFLAGLRTAVVNALAEPAVAVASLSWFQSKTVLTKKIELRYCSVLLPGTLKPLEWFTMCLSTKLVVRKSAYLVGLISHCPVLTGVRN